MTNLTKLHDLVQRTSEMVEQFMTVHGELCPAFHIETVHGELGMIVAPMPPSGERRDELAREAARVMIEKGTQRYVHIGEAWVTVVKPDDREKIERVAREGARNEPDRIEVVSFCASDRYGNDLGAERVITRDANGRPQLGPLQFSQIAAGRWYGLLIEGHA